MPASKTVVLIDDEDDLRENLRDLLAAHGFVVADAAGGREGLALLRSIESPCFVLLDLLMPDMDGWQVIEEIAKEPRLASVPLYVCTSSPDRAPPGFSLIPKPIDIVALVEQVHCHCDPGTASQS